MKSLKSILLIILLPFVMPLSADCCENHVEKSAFQASVGECDLSLLEKLRDTLHISELVTTSFNNTEIALDTEKSFSSILLIDFEELAYKKHLRTFRKKTKVTCLYASSISSLDVFFSDKTKKRLFYFNEWDGQPTQTDASQNLARLLPKLKAMKNLIASDSIIVIDNASAYLDPSKEIEASSAQLMQIINQIIPESHLYVMGDVLVFTPKQASLSVSPLVDALSYSFTKGYDQLQNAVLEKAENSLLNPSNAEEKEALLQIAQKYAAFSPALEAHTVFFEGLVHLKEARYLEASRCFHKAIALGYENWQVYWHIAQAEYQRRNIPETKRALKHITKAMPDHKESLQLLEKIDVK